MTGEKWRVIGVMLLATVAVSVGEALLAKGMKQTNGVAGGGWAQARAVVNAPVILGAFLMALYFGLYMISLKWADLSFVLPLTALSYLLGALLARFYLREDVTPARWLGAIIIMAGVVVVGLGESNATHR